MFHFNDIHLHYNKTQVLQGASLHLTQGEITLLQGQNGAGKSSLLKVMAGLLAPTGGDIRIAEQTGKWHKMLRQLRHHVCYLHQSPYIFQGDVLRNLRLIARHKSHEEFIKALDMVGIAHLATHKAHTLSGGERQRLAIARAWLHQPSVLLFDEPFANMDPEMVNHTILLMQKFQHAGKAVVICSHLDFTLRDLCQQQLYLQNGQLEHA